MQEAEMVCPECGTKIEAWESRCRNCGHKRDKKSGPIGFKIATFLLALLVLALFGLYWYEYSGHEKQETALKKDLEYLSDLNGDLKESLTFNRSRVSTLEKELEELKSSMSIYENADFYKEEYDFFCEHVCVWQDDGTNTCHMYGCQYVDRSRWDYIIINQEGAIAQMDSGVWNACTACVPNLVRGSFKYARWRRMIEENNPTT